MTEHGPFSVEELAERWNVNPATIRQMIKGGKLQAFKVGRLVRITYQEVMRHESQKEAAR